MTLYRIKPFEWVQTCDLHELLNSPYRITIVLGFGNVKPFGWGLYHEQEDLAVDRDKSLTVLKERAEDLWKSKLLAALEEVKP